MSSTPYGVSTSKGSVSYDNYVNSAIIGPLNSNRYPSIAPFQITGVLPTVKQTPMQFYPAQSPPYAEENTNARAQYRRTAISVPTRAAQIALGKQSNPMSFYSPRGLKHYAVSTHENYIAPIPSSMYVNQIKARNVGKSAYGIGLPTNTPNSTKAPDTSFTRSALRRVRNNGCTAPAKKGSVYNRSLTQAGINGWGSVIRSTY